MYPKYRKAIRNTDLSRNKQGYVFDTRPGAKEAKEAVETYEMSYGGQAELVDILIKYGKTEDECRKIGL